MNRNELYIAMMAIAVTPRLALAQSHCTMNEIKDTGLPIARSALKGAILGAEVAGFGALASSYAFSISVASFPFVHIIVGVTVATIVYDYFQSSPNGIDRCLDEKIEF